MALAMTNSWVWFLGKARELITQTSKQKVVTTGFTVKLLFNSFWSNSSMALAKNWLKKMIWTLNTTYHYHLKSFSQAQMYISWFLECLVLFKTDTSYTLIQYWRVGLAPVKTGCFFSNVCRKVFPSESSNPRLPAALLLWYKPVSARMTVFREWCVL